MATIAGLLVDLDLRSAKFNTSLDKATRNLRSSSARMNRSLKKMERGFKRVTRFVGKLGLALGVAGLGAAARRSIKDLAKLDDTAKKLGLTAEQLQELRFAGEEVGVAIITTDLALQRFIRRLGEAQGGAGELKGTLDKYNISIKNADGSTRDAVDVLEDLADVISRTKNQQEALAISFKAFDSEGAALVSLMKRGAAGMNELRQKARDLGLVIDNETVKASKSLDRQWEIIVGKMSTTWKEAVVGFAEALRLIPDAARGTGALEDELTTTVARVLALRKQLDSGRVLSRRQGGLGGGTEAELERLEKRVKQLKNAIAGPIELIPISGGRRIDALFDQDAFIKFTDSIEEQIASQERLLLSLNKTPGVVARMAAEQRIMNQLRKDDKILTGEQAEKMQVFLNNLEVATDRYEALRKKTEENEAATRDWNLAVNTAFADLILNARKATDVLDALARKFLSSALFGNDGKSGLLGGLTNSIGAAIGASTNIFGFRHGGSFEVGGAGGPDSQLVQFAATPGERVTVETPGQQRRGGGDVFSPTYNIFAGVSNEDWARLNNQIDRKNAELIALFGFANRGVRP